MTPAVMVRRLWTTRRGVGGMLIVWTVLVAGLLYVIATGYAEQAPTVRYGAAVITPIVSTLCPGETLSFDQRFVVEAADVPAVLTVNESWYSVERGVVLRGFAEEYSLPVVRPYDVVVKASRVVPDLAPGVYWFDHTATTGHSSGPTSGYTVGPVTVVECE